MRSPHGSTRLSYQAGKQVGDQVQLARPHAPMCTSCVRSLWEQAPDWAKHPLCSHREGRAHGVRLTRAPHPLIHTPSRISTASSHTYPAHTLTRPCTLTHLTLLHAHTHTPPFPTHALRRGSSQFSDWPPLTQGQLTLSVSPRPSELLLPSLLSQVAASPVGVGGVDPQPPRGRLPGSR